MAKSERGVKGFQGDGAMSLGSEAWNVADGYTKIKILKQLILLDKFENIALYGVDEIEEEGTLDQTQISLRRENALKRYISTLRQLLGNVKFAIREHDRAKIKVFLDDINTVEEYLDGVSTYENNFITHETTVVINEKHFRNCFDILQLIKDELNFPINSAGLIFRGSDEVDLDKIMQEIVSGG